MSQQPHAVINRLEVSSDTTDINALGADVTALKVAVGLLFQKLPDDRRDAMLFELRQLGIPALDDLAKQLEQFKV
ncbi:hypothetical protein [Serratia ureilytica]|uniref:hypothetical protein n=1 Tax=Serratia ureilytica TaxID=300181 RepID=UPI0018D686B2|nr:hypothetical protein [Serratia ureilytica]MBH2556792.1 hypothetical protein [Serratia ureilytica]